MAKTYKRQKTDRNEYWDDEDYLQLKTNDKNKRREKKARSALFSKDIDNLMRYSEED